MRPIAAAVARLDPDAAENPAQAKLLATASPPGRLPNHSRAAWNSEALIPEWCATAPISRNIGIAEIDQLAANSKGVFLTTPAATPVPRIRTMPTIDTPPSATPIGTLIAISARTAPMPAKPISRLVTPGAPPHQVSRARTSSRAEPGSPEPRPKWRTSASAT